MVSKTDKRQMAKFLADRLEDSGRYNITEVTPSGILIIQKPELVPNPREAYIILHNDQRTKEQFWREVREHRKNGRVLSNVFYKGQDRKDFLKRLGSSARGRDDKSLKLYKDSPEVLNSIIHLRDLEKKVLELQGVPQLTYYQPETDRLREGVRIYTMLPVTLDYSHINADDRRHGFVHDKVSDDYKIPREEIYIVKGKVQLIPTNVSDVFLMK